MYKEYLQYVIKYKIIGICNYFSKYLYNNIWKE
jgi:hypothetical protein